jgi:hypothetical protein
MAVVISVPGHEPWMVANWAFRQLVEYALPLLPLETDKAHLEQAAALGGLLFRLEEAAQAKRLAAAIETAAGRLRNDLLQSPDSEPRDLEFADLLAELPGLLKNVA